MLPEQFTPRFRKQLELLKLSHDRRFWGARQGKNVSLKKGHGIEFSDYREYQPGDNPRSIDWSLFARSDRLSVKTYQEETNVSVLFILDTSSSMMDVDRQKWERTTELVLALSYIALMDQEVVSVLPLGGGLLRNASGGRSIHRIADYLLQISPGDPAHFEKELLSSLSRIKLPGICIFISDFLFPLPQIRALIRTVQRRNFELSAIQVLGEYDLDPLQGERSAFVVDSESGETLDVDLGGEESIRYSNLLEQHSSQLRTLCHQRNIRFSRITAVDDLFVFLSHELVHTGLLS
jgi:uncharacterized protein (DUF58 family)